MAGAQNKTTANNADADAFLAAVSDPEKREDCVTIRNMMAELSGHEPVMWGASIVGFGRYHYRYESGREGDFFLTGFSPRAKNISLYIMAGFNEYQDLLDRLGKHSTGRSCLYIKRLSDIDEQILRDMIGRSLDWMHARYPDSD